MQWFILLFLSVLSTAIFYQDYKTRSVVWLLFPCIMLTGILYTLYYGRSINLLIINSVINLGFLLLQFILLKIIFRFKKIINQKIGTGDILFAICTCTFFSPANFLIYYVLSLVFSLCFHLLLQKFNKNDCQTSIPLAGMQAVFLFALISLTTLAGINAITDSFLN